MLRVSINLVNRRESVPTFAELPVPGMWVRSSGITGVLSLRKCSKAAGPAAAG